MQRDQQNDKLNVMRLAFGEDRCCHHAVGSRTRTSGFCCTKDYQHWPNENSRQVKGRSTWCASKHIVLKVRCAKVHTVEKNGHRRNNHSREISSTFCTLWKTYQMCVCIYIALENPYRFCTTYVLTFNVICLL